VKQGFIMNKVLLFLTIFTMAGMPLSAIGQDNDMDNDGVWDNIDNDMDNDGVWDNIDNDMDNDGVWDNIDNDMDNDGIWD